jgi:hypothetical protein
MSDKLNPAQTQVFGRTICTACGDDAGDKPVKLMSLPGVRWSEAPNPRAAWALVRKARAEGVQPKVEQVLCARCARHLGAVS